MTIVDRIIETKRREVEASRRRRPIEGLREAAGAADPTRDFSSAVTAPRTSGIHLIAEIKRRSPSAGLIREDFDPIDIARTYAACGASAISVLTDETYFDGRLEYIAIVKQAVPLPVLRKDFIIDEYQLFESRVAGADAVLLIAEAIGASGVASMLPIARGMGLHVLVEVHTADNLAALLDAIGPPAHEASGARSSAASGAASSIPSRAVDGMRDGEPNLATNCTPSHDYVLGINNRDLSVQRTDLAVTERLASMLPPGTPFVTESGLATREDVTRVTRAGASAMLVGESLLKSRDISAQIDLLTN